MDQKKEELHHRAWAFICGKSQLSLKSDGDIKYNNHTGKLKTGDIVEVIMDTNTGTLSFKVNDIDYGVATKEIPTNIDLVPVVSKINLTLLNQYNS